MSQPAPVAFGKYLRSLRERRGLSLQDVASLSGSSVEPMNKGYLSRCENGRQKLAFAKVISLSHLYDVPADVLVERMELDLELDRVGGPDTDGMEFRELSGRGRAAINEGWKWKAYGFARDASSIAASSELSPTFRDQDEQLCVAIMNVATIAVALKKSKFALHELHYACDCHNLSEKFQPLILERIGSAYLADGQTIAAEGYTDKAIAAARSSRDTEYLGYYFAARGLVAIAKEEFGVALDLYKQAYSAYKESGKQPERAATLNNLAQLYFSTGRYASARRALENASRLAREFGLHRVRGLSELLQGEIDEIERRPLLAKRRWKKCVEIAKEINDRELRFKAEFLLYRIAKREDETPVARSIGRRLTRLAPWVSRELPELKMFREERADGAA